MKEVGAEARRRKGQGTAAIVEVNMAGWARRFSERRAVPTRGGGGLATERSKGVMRFRVCVAQCCENLVKGSRSTSGGD